MKRYTKKPKPLSRKTLERKLREAGRTVAEQATLIEEKSETISRMRGSLQSAQSRVRELEARLDGIFLPVKPCLRTYAEAVTLYTHTCRAEMPVLDMRMRIDPFEMQRAYDADHMKAHIVDMMIRELREKALKAISVV